MYKLIMKSCNFRSQNTSKKCYNAVDYAMKHEFGDVDHYSIYTPTCKAASKEKPKYYSKLKNTLISLRFAGYDPCTERYAEKYYNRIDVQKALHANSTGIPYKWTACSGDTDSVVPVTATRFSLSHLNLKVKTPWYPWYSDGQVGGRTEVYEGLTFATIRGAGHEVPLFEAKRAFDLFRTFLSGKNFPKP
ncbi:Serine carboxypeptidase 24 [Orobanche gracilis]